MVNNNFYVVMNELFQRATKGTVAAVVDYDTFVDAGKALEDISSTDLQNEMVTPIMQKIQKTLLDTPSYVGALTSMYQGRLDYGILEMIMGDFYDVSASTFDGASTLVDGQTYTDQFKVTLPKTTARYYDKSDSWMRTITVRDTDIKGAFATPQGADALIRKWFVDIANSNELHKELNRLGLFSDLIKETVATTPEVADENAVAQNYSLVTIYNTLKGTTLPTDEGALLNNDFVTWATGVIRDISMLMEKPTDKFNTAGEITTFSPKSYQSLKINSVFDKAIRRSLVDAYNPEYGMIQTNYEVLPYWQNISDRLKVTTNATGEETTYSVPVIAVLHDTRAIGEMVQLEETATTRNDMRRYTNYHFQFNSMYWLNPHANSVVFTLA